MSITFVHGTANHVKLSIELKLDTLTRTITKTPRMKLIRTVMTTKQLTETSLLLANVPTSVRLRVIRLEMPR